MKKTRLLVLFRNIWSTKVSFLSIVLFVGLGIGIFLGIRWNGPAIHNTVDAYYEEHKFHDYAVSFPYGITEEDVKAIQALDDVSEAEGGYTADGSVRLGEDTYVVDIQSMTKEMDLAVASEGELPDAADEVGIERAMATEAGLEIGDVLVIQSKIAGNDSLVNQRFTITGFVEHPSYISRRSSYSRGSASIGDGVVNYYVLMSPEAFDKSAYDDCYSNVYVRCSSLRGLNSYEEKYLERADVFAEELSSLGEERGQTRYEAVEGRYQGELDSARAQITDGEKQIADGEKALTDGAKEIDQAQRQIADGEKELAAAEAQLADGERQLAAGEAEYAAKQREFAAGEAQVREGERQLAAAESQYAAKKKEYDAGAAQVADGLNQYQQYRTQLQPVLDQMLTAEVDPPSPMRELRRAVMVKHGLDPDHVEISADPATANGQLDQAVDVTDELDDLVDVMLEEDGEDHVVELQPGKYGPQETQTLDVHITKEELDREKEGLTATRKVMTGTQEQLGVYLDGKAQLDAAKVQLDSAASQLQEGRAELASGKAQLEDARAQLAAGLAQLQEARAQVQAGRDQVEAGRAELASGKEQLEEKKKELEDGRKQLEESKKQLEDGKKQLEEAEGSAGNLVEYTSWILEKRADNVDYNVAKGYCDIGRKLCFSLALLFVFVGVMICYTSISRIVQEQQVMTGVEKALGFTEKEILMHYLQYASLTVLMGGIFGAVLGYFLVEGVMNRTLSEIFIVGALRSHFSLLDLLVIMALELLLIALAAWIACHRQLGRRAIELLRGEKKSNSRTRFYEKLSWWKRIPLYTQMTVNNLMNDKTRMVATLVGVAGCTSLIVMALTFQQALKNTPEKHFSQVSVYDMRLIADDTVEGGMDRLAAVLDQEEVSYLKAQHKNGMLVDEDGQPHVTDLIVPESPEKLSSYFRLRDSSTHREVELPENGVLLNKTYTRYHDVKVGDTLRILDTSGTYREVVVAGIVDHYLSLNQIFMSPEYYKEVTGESPKSNTFYINLHGADAAALKSKLAKVNGYLNFKDDHTKWEQIFSTFQSITSLVVLIALFMSAMMALLVLLNLNVMLIKERTRELIVMRINGFSVRATKRYVYRDNIVLTALGIILGVGLGMALAVFVIVSASSENSSIITDQNLGACLEAIVITVFFAVITNLIALSQVDKLKVSDLNKL